MSDLSVFFQPEKAIIQFFADFRYVQVPLGIYTHSMSTAAANLRIVLTVGIFKAGEEMPGPVKNADAGRGVIPIAGSLAFRYVNDVILVDPDI